ncbi:MAG TPA: RagB/SusD family nutrient uptake outer membrane protein [Gemmatimonadaceae bacterium]|nr:RagB/SusD family nutrient uptake outer membrane protein [Gemmatimonadaceae bacterium]
MASRSGGWRYVALGALAATVACSELTSLDQEAPSRVVANDLYTPANAQLLVTSTISDYECALAQYIVAAGLVGDELIDAQLSQQGWDYDRRTIVPSLGAYSTVQCGATQVPGYYTPISIARSTADKILTSLEGWTDQEVTGRQDLIAQAAAHAGYSLILLGESACSAAINGGAELTPTQVLTEAEARFTKAITAAQAANNTDILNMARVGRARARTGLKKFAEAKADAALVPETYVHNANYSAATFRRENLINTQFFRGLFASVDPSFRGLTVGGVADPRVVVVDAGAVGHDGVTRVWRTTKYATSASPIPIASGDEAILIVAEADLEAGNLAAATAGINKLRTKSSLPAFAGGTAAEVRAQLIDERRRELFLEGQRLGDIIRFNIPQTPAAGTAYPAKGGLYGNQLCFPLPDVERNNNPTLSGKAS